MQNPPTPAAMHRQVGKAMEGPRRVPVQPRAGRGGRAELWAARRPGRLGMSWHRDGFE